MGVLSLLWRGTKAVAAGKTQANLGIQSPHLPNAITRVGRFLFSTSGIWIAASWYSGYVNKRTEPGSGLQLIAPGSSLPIINPPDRPNRSLKFPGLGGGGSGGSDNGTVSIPSNSGPGKGTNPFPGATGSRLDQGFDLTSQVFRAPADSRILYATNSDPGWKGGGYVAGVVQSGPKRGMVWYMAEGLRPRVVAGQVVKAGTKIADPVPNPYNGYNGNIEAGWANPGNPRQPLAQVHSNPPGVAWDFYNWIQSLGGPKASSTGNAGYP